MIRVAVYGLRGFPQVQGGVERHCERLYSTLVDTEVVVFRRKPYCRVDDSLPHIRFVDLPSTRIRGVETFLHSFLAACRCVVLRPDVVHVHNIGPGFFLPLLKLVGLKTVLTYHSSNYEHAKWGIFARLLLRSSEWVALRAADAVIFVSRVQYERLAVGRIASKSCCIPNGVEPAIRAERINYLTSIGVTPRRYVLAVGRITQEKGFDYLMDAFLGAHLPDMKLVVVGSADHRTPYVDAVYNKASLHPTRIVMAGFVAGEALCQLYTHARLFVLPSFHEGFSVALLEAMSYGLVVRASDIDSNRQFNLPTDCYFEAGSVDGAAARMREAVAVSESPCVYDLRAYDLQQIGDETACLYRRVISPSAHQSDLPPERWYNRWLKRFFDLMLSSFLLLTLFPILFLCVAIGIKCTMAGPIFFFQRRTGLNGREFTCVKFRSMRLNREADELQASADDPRVTRFGRFLRNSSLDETPQLINVFVGDMSLIGPRPHMLKHTEYYARLIAHYADRHCVKPGITGWAQVCGFRGSTPRLEQMERRVAADIWYVRHRSPLLDLRILLKTLLVLVVR